MIEIALDAVKKAEKELLNFKNNPIIISEKKRDIKTKADLVSNKILIDSLSKTNIPLISEEIPSMLTDCVLLFRNEANHLFAIPLIP